MDKNQCFELGYIERTHGYDGSVVAFFDVDDSSRYQKIDALFIETGLQLIPYLIGKISSIGRNQFLIQFQNVVTEDDAKKLKGSKIYLPEQALPALKPNQYYYHELVGCKVEDKKFGLLGDITEIIDLPRQTLATMMYDGHEVLIPVHSNIVLSLDRNSKVVKTNLPDGLLDVYCKPEAQEEI